MANYVIVGAGRDASHPIQVNVRCDNSTTICWIGKYCKTVCDVEMCTEDQYCETVSTTSEGPHQTMWTDPDGISHTIYYNVKRNCPPVVPPSCEYTCSDLTAYAVPSSVAEDYPGYIDIHYEYYFTCVSGDYIGDRVKKSGVKTVAFSEFSNYSYNLSVDGCSTTVKLNKKEEDDCTVGCVADISITFSQDVVPASGKTIQIIVSFKKTVTDENCKKKVTTGSFSKPWEVKCTPVDENDKHCCKDHYVEGWISKAEVKSLGKLDGCELRYDGEQTAIDLYYKVLQKGKTTEECEDFCEEKTTYCVDQSTVKVCYEKRYLSNEWVCEGDPSTDCDCTALSIEGVNGAYAVPFTGGRIKVTWQYSAHTTTETCNEYDTLGKTWEEIITIGGCDERPIDCKPEYNTVVVDEEGHTAIYDDTTYKDCEICDSECCYNYDGKGTCRCVILFKEQTPGCTTCESCDVYDEEEQRTITYNKIRYEFVQDCTTICNYDKNTQFEQKEINVDKCFTGETAATVPFTSTTEYYGAGCPAPKVIIDSVEAKANIPTVNNSNRPKVAYEDDMIKVIQAAGPCETPAADCDCYSISIEGEGPEPTECTSWGSWSWNTAYVSCNGGDSSAVVTGSRTCLTDPSKTQTTSSTVTFATTTCRSGDDETIYNRDGKTVIQRGGCSCGGETTCICSLSGEYNRLTNKYSNAGSGGVRDKIGTYTIGSECGGTLQFDKIVPGSNNESTAYQLWTSTSDFRFENGEIKAVIPPNNTDGVIHIHCHFKCKTASTASDTDYINFYQEAGGSTPTTCEVTADSTLDGYVSKFNSSLGTTISTANTPCTYSYLKEAYSAVSSKGSTTIMWMLANVLSELTPNVNKTTKYFEVATNDSGGVLDLINSESVYNSRINGGVEYARWKHNNFESKNEMAEFARSELRDKGVSTASLISVPSEFVRGEVINPVNIVPNMNGQTSLSQINQSDISAMSSILTTYPDSASITSSSLGNNPFADKEYCSKRLCQILGLSTSDSNWLDFIDYAKDATDAAVNVIKRGISGVSAQHRLRPTGQSIEGKTANMVCGGSAEQDARDLCGDSDTCESEYNAYIGDTGSYPSGHSGRGFIAGLVYLQTKGVDKIDRMNQYCHNRAIVRAHWVSDTIAAKVITSTVIGFLNGVREYLNKVNNLM